LRLTYSDLRTDWLDNIGQSGNSDASLIAFFDRKLMIRYELIMAELTGFKTTVPKTDVTVASQQAYNTPVGTVTIVSATVDTGSLVIPLDVVDSQREWDFYNQLDGFTSGFPLKIFPKRDTYELWPVPATAGYTITLNTPIRARALSTVDYTTGTVTATNGSTVLTGSGTTFTSSMVGRWFRATADGEWYRIATFTSTTVLGLHKKFEGTTASSLAYRIGESPEIPEEGHILLSDGPTADYIAGPRGDKESGTWWENKFWTGNGKKSTRDGEDIWAGLIGLKKRYSQRSESAIIRHNREGGTEGNLKLWGTVLSE
jgi:hypothetical protein